MTLAQMLLKAISESDPKNKEMQVLGEANAGYSALAQSFKSKYFPRNSPNLTSFKDIESHIENYSNDPYQKFGAESLIELVIAELVLTHGAKINFSKGDIVNYPLAKSIQTKFDNKTLTKVLQ